MASNPLVAQGTLNRIRGSVSVLDAPELNVTAPFLGKEGIRLSIDGEATTYIPTMTGAVTSAEPYQMITLTVHLLKTQSIANLYKNAQETQSVLGDIVVTSDTSSLNSYYLTNCAIKTVTELNFSGEDAGYVITIGGYYLTNSSTFDLQ